MSHNLGTADRIIRAAVVAPLLIVLAFVAGPSGALGIILLAVAAVMLVTAAAGFCPLYRLVGLNSCPARRRPAAGS